jgi:hypothetical protein
MRTLRFLFCAACLCSVGVLAKTALTQDDRSRSDEFSDAARPKDSPPTNGFPERGEDSNVPPAGFGGGGFGGGSRLSGGRGGLGGFNSSSVQPQPDSRFTQLMRPRRVTRTVTESFMEPIPPEELEAIKKLQTAIQQLTNGKDEDTRKAAAGTVQLLLTIQFEADLKQREKELEEVEQRVKSLREQLEKRKVAQADIINLRLQTLVNNANGLGFPDANWGTSEVNFLPREYALPSNAPFHQPGQSDSDRSDRFDRFTDEEAKPTRQ